MDAISPQNQHHRKGATQGVGLTLCNCAAILTTDVRLEITGLKGRIPTRGDAFKVCILPVFWWVILEIVVINTRCQLRTCAVILGGM